MNKTLKGYVLGLLTAAFVAGGVSYAAQNVKIIIDGQELIPKDANGNRVYPIIENGTTYLPVRAIANAFGKEVYWDGPNYTVYIGSMNGKLEYPTEELSCDDDIGDGWQTWDNLQDNYGNYYSRAINTRYSDATYEKICNYRFSTFRGTIYVPNECTDGETQVIIKTDGKTIYTSPIINKATAPIPLELDITGCNDFQICSTTEMGGFWGSGICIGDGGFYQ